MVKEGSSGRGVQTDTRRSRKSSAAIRQAAVWTQPVWMDTMKLLNIDSYYAAFLHSFYGAHPEFAYCSYDEQWRTLMDQCFGAADFYSAAKQAFGGEVVEVVFNRDEIEEIFAEDGLVIQAVFESIPYDVSAVLDEPTWTLTYLCRKG